MTVKTCDRIQGACVLVAIMSALVYDNFHGVRFLAISIGLLSAGVSLWTYFKMQENIDDTGKNNLSC